MSKIPAPHRDYTVLGDTDNKQIINKNKIKYQLVINVIKVYKSK